MAMPEAVGNDERMQNIGKAEFTGVELEGEWRFAPEWTAYGTLAFVEGRNKTDDEYLRFTPPLNGLLGIRYDRESVSGPPWNLTGPPTRGTPPRAHPTAKAGPPSTPASGIGSPSPTRNTRSCSRARIWPTRTTATTSPPVAPGPQGARPQLRRHLVHGVLIRPSPVPPRWQVGGATASAGAPRMLPGRACGAPHREA